MKIHMLSTNQVAEALNISSYMVRELIKDGKLPATKINYRTLRVRKDDLEKFINDRSTFKS